MDTVNEKPTVQLICRDGSAFAIIGACRRAAKLAGWTPEQITQFSDEAMSGDYDNVLRTAMKYFEVE